MSKILLVVNSMHTGGAERVAATLANAWSARGNSVTLVITYSGRGECHYELDKAVSVVFIADLLARPASRVLGYIKRIRALRTLVKKSQPDIIISFLTNVNVSVIISCTGLGYPLIVSERTHPPQAEINIGWRLMRKLTYPSASYVIMLASDGLDWLRNSIPHARGAIIPNPVAYPLAVRTPLLRVDDYVESARKLILAVGRLDSNKQFNHIIESFCRLNAVFSDWDLIIAGEGPEHDRLQLLILELGLSDRIKLVGRVGNLSDWYERADVYIMSSRVEGFPNTLAEAMAYGCPAVSYDCDTGPRDIISNGVDGFLVKPVGNIEALTAALKELMTDELMRDEMGNRARAIGQRYSVEKIIEDWDAVFLAAKKNCARKI